MKKWCYVATETKKGWRLKFAYGSKTYNFSGFIIKKIDDIKMILPKGKIVFIHLKDCKCKVK